MKRILKHIILYLIQLIERYEYRHLDLNENDNSKKIIDTIDISDYEIETDTGFKPITHIHKTQPYRVWRIETENGFWLEGADNHIIFDDLMNEVFIKDLEVNQYIQTENGKQRVIKIEHFYNKVSMYDVTVDDENHRFYSNGILSHNTTTIAAFFAWYLCFHTDRNLAILANKQATTTEIVRKVTEVFKGLPFFLKPGIENIGALGLRLDNGCMLTSQSTTGSSSLGFTIHVLYIDEFAHIQPNITAEFWRSVYPTIASSEISQCIISSTPNGMDNLFYQIWDKANRGTNSFGYKRVDWWEVPGHDDEWASKMMGDFGEEEFAQEFALQFDIKSNNLLSGSDLKWVKRLASLQGDYEFQELGKSDLDDKLYENLKFRKDFDINKDFNEKTDRLLFSVDLAEGKDEDEVKDNDYNITNIFNIKLKSLSKLKLLRKDQRQIENMFRLEQVGLYRDNIKDETEMAKVNMSLVFDQIGEELVKMVVEMNFNGKAFTNKFSEHDKYYDGILMRSWHTAPVPGQKPPRKKTGFKVRGDKDHYARAGKKLIHNKTLIPNENETYQEFSSFGRVKKSWKGIGKHDDIAMTTLNISRIFDEPEYGDWLYDFLDALYDSPEKRLALLLLEEPNDTGDMEDGLFAALYGDEDVNPLLTEQERLEEIFKTHEVKKGSYSPGISIGLNKM